MSEIIPTGWQIVGVGDFNGDGISDLLLRNTDGTITDWLGQPDQSFASNAGNINITVPTEWHVVGTGDFNGSNIDDILWRADDGTVREWLGQTTGAFVGNLDNLNSTVPNAFHILGTGDFNGDGIDDILWRYDDGTVSDWLGQPNGSFVSNVGNVNVYVPNDWQIVGTGDFNGDGRADLLWRGSDGTVRDWLGQENGAFVGNVANLNAGSPTDWQIVGTGDFNGDGRSDILWRSADGTINDWLGQANGAFADNSGIALQAVSNDLQIAGVGDFNGDGRSDLLFRYPDGTLETWVGAPDGSILSPMEKLWQDTIANAAEFVDEVADQLAPPSPNNGYPNNSLTGYAAIFGPSYPTTFEEALYEESSNFTLHTFDQSGQSASYSTGSTSSSTQHFGSITQIDSAGNAYLISVNGMNLVGNWFSGPPPSSPPPSNAIVITGHLNTNAGFTNTGFFLFDPNSNGLNLHDGFGGHGLPASPLRTALSHSAMVTVGHHNIYLPPLDSLSAEEKSAALAFIAAVQTIDALIGSLSATAQMTVTETWTDSAGQSHTLTLNEAASDLTGHWANTSFGLFTGADFSTLNGPGTNGTDRGSSNIGWDPNMPGNLVAGFNIGSTDTGLLGYYNGNGSAAMDYLALHEVAHNTVAGFIMNSATANRTDTFIPGTPNWANENLANTFALATMEALGLSLAEYNPVTGHQTPTAGWQTASHWNVNP
jgi:hypothetical protein